MKITIIHTSRDEPMGLSTIYDPRRCMWVVKHGVTELFVGTRDECEDFLDMRENIAA